MRNLVKRIIRPKHNKTLGIHIKHIEYNKYGKYAITVKYFSTERNIGMDFKDVLYLTKEDLYDNFEILVNADRLKNNFKKAKWKPLVDKKQETSACE